jgi:23S rRNA pseudouridine1911/1915/1917 synthase
MEAMQQRVEIMTTTEHRRMRLEDLLLERFGTLSKMYLRELVKTEQVEVNGRSENIGYRIVPGDFVEISVDMTRGTSMRSEEMPLDIVHEDDSLIVVNKPAGMLVHPSHRENKGTLLNGLTHHLNRNGGPRIRPGLPHRLDKQTSGLLVIAKTARSHRILSGHFMKKRVTKRYLALVDGIVTEGEGGIEAPIGRFDELKYWGVKDDGKASETRFWTRRRLSDKTLVELEPVTGRTNQLRIHCEKMGHPIVGDIQRGGSEFPRLCLHAYKLAFPHPEGNQMVSFEIPLPADFGVTD